MSVVLMHDLKWMPDCQCNKCRTLYSDDDLELLEDKDGFFKGCRVCKTDSHLMDFDHKGEVT